MSKYQPKSRTTTIVDVIAKPGGRKGKFELTSGNVSYFRPSAKTETLTLTYQQLMLLLENELEYQSIDTAKVKLPKPHQSGDFVFEVMEVNEAEDQHSLLFSRSSINKIDPRRVDLGAYQFSSDMANGRRTKKYQWFAQVSIQAALWIINQYIDKFLVAKKMSDHTDENVVVSKKRMREVLFMLLKKVDS